MRYTEVRLARSAEELLIDMNMEDHFGMLLYLVVGIIYCLKTAKRRNAEQQPAEALSSAPYPSSADSWEEGAPEAQQPSITAVPPRPVPSTPIQHPAQKPSPQKIDCVLSRYSGWKKAMVMRELIQPYS